LPGNTVGEGTPQLSDDAGGGSAKEWTATVTKVLALDFDTVVPGHGNVVKKADMRAFRASTARLTERVESEEVLRCPAEHRPASDAVGFRGIVAREVSRQ
jgi:glyoxylase-like metal-dependent hydrolase (beta-lactamase superfamily II)